MRIVLIYFLVKKVGGRGAGGDIAIHKEEIREHLRKKKEAFGLYNLPFDHRKQRRVVFHQPRMNTPVKAKRQYFTYTSWLIVVN